MTYGCISRNIIFIIGEVIVLSYSVLIIPCLKHCVQFLTQGFKEPGAGAWD